MFQFEERLLKLSAPIFIFRSAGPANGNLRHVLIRAHSMPSCRFLSRVMQPTPSVIPRGGMVAVAECVRRPLFKTNGAGIEEPSVWCACGFELGIYGNADGPKLLKMSVGINALSSRCLEDDNAQLDPARM